MSETKNAGASKPVPSIEALFAGRVDDNNPTLKGRLASQLFHFGRYAVAAIHTRFDAVEWIVQDSETFDALTGLPEIIRQAPTLAEALVGFHI